jgi:hypothetical protein
VKPVQNTEELKKASHLAPDLEPRCPRCASSASAARSSSSSDAGLQRLRLPGGRRRRRAPLFRARPEVSSRESIALTRSPEAGHGGVIQACLLETRGRSRALTWVTWTHRLSTRTHRLRARRPRFPARTHRIPTGHDGLRARRRRIPGRRHEPYARNHEARCPERSLDTGPFSSAPGIFARDAAGAEAHACPHEPELRVMSQTSALMSPIPRPMSPTAER